MTNAYYLLAPTGSPGKKVGIEGSDVPPVMITVTNKTETAARIKYAFDHNKFLIEELVIRPKPSHRSKVMKEAESQEEFREMSSTSSTTKTPTGTSPRRIKLNAPHPGRYRW